MVIPGKFVGGVVVLEGNPHLPEGADVAVSNEEKSPITGIEKQRIQVPLVQTGSPGSVQLTGQRIAEILDEDDAAS